MWIVDMVCQFIIVVFGLAAIILVGQGNRWGFVIGLIQQPAWFVTTFYNEQWGVLVLSVAYAGSWMLGIYHNFFKEKNTGMTNQKIREVIRIYRMMFMERRVGIADYPHDRLLCHDVEGLEHCHGMLAKIETFLDEGRREKAFRWLGFLQGFLWAVRVYTLDELCSHNRPS